MRGSLRRLVAKRAGYCCEYCRTQQRYSPQEFSAEHIVPRAAGGASTADNVAWACQACNNSKFTFTAAPDPSTGSLTPLFNPRRDRWEDHFAWHAEFAYVIGITPTGRATVDRLKLNREGFVEMRQVLRALGRHPPSVLA